MTIAVMVTWAPVHDIGRLSPQIERVAQVLPDCFNDVVVLRGILLQTTGRFRAIS
jgi:hypothetical protein